MMMMIMMERALSNNRKRLVMAVVVGIVSCVLATRAHNTRKATTTMPPLFGSSLSVVKNVSAGNIATSYNNDDSSTTTSIVADLMDTYSTIVAGFVQQQTMSWHVHASALAKDERTVAQRDQARRTWQHHAPRQWKALRREQLQRVQQAAVVQNQTATAADGSSNTNDNTMIWDREEDISLYLDKLARNCAETATKPKFKREMPFEVTCWDFLEDLISQPRCTSRLDSRYTCDGSPPSVALSPRQQLAAGKALLKQHFADKHALHVVILGAGPVGLFLANALTGLTLDSARSMRIVVLENRIVQQQPQAQDNNVYPIKRPYSRNWITDLDLNFMEGKMDLALERFIQAVHEPENYRVPLPINALETLLLLSNRQRGVKFLYDDYQNYQQILQSTPNLVAFDATGHRLDGPVEQVIMGNHDATTSTTARPWTWEKMRLVDKRFFTERVYQELVQMDALVPIAQRQLPRGPILFPVSHFDNVQPYTAHMLKINDIRMASKDWTRLVNLQEKMPAKVSPYCKSKRYSPCRKGDETNKKKKKQAAAAAADEEKQDTNAQVVSFDTYIYHEKTCYEWCGQISVYDQAGFYRSDIEERMREQRPTHLGLTVLLASLTPNQADALWYLLERRRHAVLLQDLPLARLARMEVFRQNEMKRLLTFLSQTEFTGRADVSLFALRPYMYSDPVVPGGLFGHYHHSDTDNHNAMIPLLRVGDSLASGDPNLGTGLGFHVQVIEKLVDQMKGLLA